MLVLYARPYHLPVPPTPGTGAIGSGTGAGTGAFTSFGIFGALGRQKVYFCVVMTIFLRASRVHFTFAHILRHYWPLFHVLPSIVMFVVTFVDYKLQPLEYHHLRTVTGLTSYDLFAVLPPVVAYKTCLHGVTSFVFLPRNAYQLPVFFS